MKKLNASHWVHKLCLTLNGIPLVVITRNCFLLQLCFLSNYQLYNKHVNTVCSQSLSISSRLANLQRGTQFLWQITICHICRMQRPDIRLSSRQNPFRWLQTQPHIPVLWHQKPASNRKLEEISLLQSIHNAIHFISKSCIYFGYFEVEGTFNSEIC